MLTNGAAEPDRLAPKLIAPSIGQFGSVFDFRSFSEPNSELCTRYTGHDMIEVM